MNINPIQGLSNSSFEGGNVGEEEDLSNQEIIETAQQLINELSSLPNISDEIEKEEIPKVEEINEAIGQIDDQVQKLTADVDAQIISLLNSSAGMTEEEKAKEAIKIIEQQYGTIEGKLKDSVEMGKKVEEVANYLHYPTVALLLGMHFAEIINSHLSQPLDFAGLAGGIGGLGNLELGGLSIIGLGFKCYSLQKRGEEIKVKEERKQVLIEKVKVETNAGVLEDLNAEIEMLDRVIDSLKSDLKLGIVEASQAFMVDLFEHSSELINAFTTSSDLLVNHADLVARLMEISNGVSIAGSLISLGWTTYQVYNHSSKLRHANQQISHLTSRLIAMTKEEAYLAYILQSKLDRLNNIRSNEKVDLGLQVVKFSATSLALTSALKGSLILAGVAIGTTASVALSGAGITGIVLLSGTLAAGTGIVVYKNRYNIEYGVKAVPLLTQKLILKKQLARANVVQEKAQEKMGLLVVDFKENSKKKAELFEVPDNIEEALTRRNPQAAFSSVLAKEQLISKEIDDLREILNSSIKSINELKTTIQQLESKQQEHKERRDLKNFRNQFNNYDLTTLNIIRKVLDEGLNTEESRNQIRDFLRSENFPVPRNVEWKHVLDYILEN